MSDQEYAAAISYLIANVEAYGVGSVKVRDGQIFMLTREKLQSIMDAMEPDQNEVIVFVKSGGAPSDELA